MKNWKNKLTKLDIEIMQLQNYIDSGKFGRQYIVRKLGQIKAEMILLKAIAEKEEQEGENNEI